MSNRRAPVAKSAEADLALFGGPALFPEVLHVGRPSAGDLETLLGHVRAIYDARWLTNDGPYVHELEHRLALLHGVAHCVAMCNGTVALEIAARALGLHGEVIVPSFTFAATAHCLQWQEITPVFCDIDPLSHNIDPTRIGTLVTPRTTGIIGVHLWGRACEVEALERVAAEHGLRLLFDSAHALGCSRRGRMIGGAGDAEVLSLHATKIVSGGEGGAVLTNDGALAETLRLMRNFGFRRLDTVVSVGTNGKMSELSAAAALVSLDHLEAAVASNRRNYLAYRERLLGLSGVTVIPYDDSERCNYQYVVLEIDTDGFGLGRDQLIAMLHAENVRARRYFWPGCHRMEPYRSFFPNSGLLLPQTEAVASRVLQLPTGETVSEADIDAICALLRFASTHAAGIRRRAAQPPA